MIPRVTARQGQSCLSGAPAVPSWQVGGFGDSHHRGHAWAPLPSPVLCQARRAVRAAARTPSTVLVTGALRGPAPSPRGGANPVSHGGFARAATSVLDASVPMSPRFFFLFLIFIHSGLQHIYVCHLFFRNRRVLFTSLFSDFGSALPGRPGGGPALSLCPAVRARTCAPTPERTPRVRTGAGCGLRRGLRTAARPVWVP